MTATRDDSEVSGAGATASLAMLHPAQVYEKNETISGGVCDFCGEEAPALKVFNRAPMAGGCYCRKCAPLSETDADWPNGKLSHAAQPAGLPATGDSGKRCGHDIRKGFIPYWRLYDFKECGKRAHWRHHRGGYFCTRHAKQRGLQNCTAISPNASAEPRRP